MGWGELSRPDLIARLRAALRLLFPDEMTPQAKHVIESILDEYAT